ncbi:conditioned medium-induced protein 4 [Halovivax cerinus]|uniref:Conditioned medium-induced protein 4 n=1 Tax=Halovivax cerinus TaxID=1487865 RepID=A0ABD5NRI1_9EURY|nr:conditioned medium-induced protein 4 [Halovivax cerinus]
MNEKTEELREIFTEVTDEETVTESQEAGRGSLEQDERDIEDRLEGVIERMRERYEFDTSLTTAELQTVARAFYEGAEDDEIADDLDVEPGEVFDARLALHLTRTDEVDEVDLVALREHDGTPTEIAAEFDCDVDEVTRYRAIAEARAESRAANDRYRDEFDSILADTELSTRMASDVREDGLEDATEGMETDVSF